MRKWIFASIFMIVLMATTSGCSFQPRDIPGIGDDTIAFTIHDGFSYDVNYSGDTCQWDFERNNPYIVNPSPQRCQLEVKNLETEKVYTIRHRIILDGNKYQITRLSLSGDTLSTHHLTITR